MAKKKCRRQKRISRPDIREAKVQAALGTWKTWRDQVMAPYLTGPPGAYRSTVFGNLPAHMLKQLLDLGYIVAGPITTFVLEHRRGCTVYGLVHHRWYGNEIVTDPHGSMSVEGMEYRGDPSKEFLLDVMKLLSDLQGRIAHTHVKLHSRKDMSITLSVRSTYV